MSFTVQTLSEAVQRGDLSQVRALLDARPELVDIDMAENDEHRALHYAVMQRNPEMVRLLMERGADARKGIYPHRQATSALTIATDRGYDEIAAIIRDAEQQRPATIHTANAPTLSPAEAAVARGDAEWLRARHAEGALENHIDQGGGLLTVAVTHDRPEILALLLDLGFDPNERVRLANLEEVVYTQAMPLWHCAQKGKLAMAETLLRHGANPNVHVYASGSSVYIAYSERQWPMVELLKRHGGVVDPVTIGLFHEKQLAQQMLLDEKEGRLPAGILERRNVSEDLLRGAADSGDAEILRMALPGVDWPPDDDQWYWILMQAIWAPSPECFALLLRRTNPNLRHPRFGRTLLHDVAALGGDPTAQASPTLAAILLDAGARFDDRDDILRSTPLGWACRWGRVPLVKFLLDRGADPIEPSADPWATPRAWAHKRGHTGVLQLLRER